VDAKKSAPGADSDFEAAISASTSRRGMTKAGERQDRENNG
jgi:hypothetical protein